MIANALPVHAGGWVVAVDIDNVHLLSDTHVIICNIMKDGRCSKNTHCKEEEEDEEKEECCLFDHHGSGGYIIKTKCKSLTRRPPKYRLQFSYVAKKINIVN